jgi:hypothetical protein
MQKEGVQFVYAVITEPIPAEFYRRVLVNHPTSLCPSHTHATPTRSNSLHHSSLGAAAVDAIFPGNADRIYPFYTPPPSQYVE